MKPTFWGLLLIICIGGAKGYGQDSPLRSIDSLRQKAQQIKAQKVKAEQNVFRALTYLLRIDRKIQALPAGTYPADSAYRFYVEEALVILDQLFAKVTSLDQRKRFLQYEADFFDGALQACYRKFRASQDRRFLDKAFAIIERQKVPFSQIPGLLPTPTLQRLQQLERQLESLQDSIRYTSGAQRRLRDKKLVVQKRLQTLHDTILLDHPTYQSYLSAQQILALDSLQATLAPQEALVDYFINKQSIYAFVLRKDTLELVYSTFIRNDDFPTISAVVQRYLQALQQPALYEDLVLSAHRLHQLLVEPLAPLLVGVEKITVIPDPLLVSIPFEPLLRQRPAKLNADYSKLDYLIDHYQLAYHRSATEWGQQRLSPSPLPEAPRIAAFAPGFGQRLHRQYQSFPAYAKDQAFLAFDSLPHLTRNLDWLAAELGATTFQWEEATLSNFKQHTDQNILHLGTHLVTNDTFLLNSQIVFAKDRSPDGSLDQGRITLQELSLAQPEAQLAFLAACTSGKDGFGFAYAFESSGISSTLYSLWRVNDKESAQVVRYFYEYLAQNKAKDEALHLAKKRYLQQAQNIKFAPKYWAVFVFNGDARPFAFRQTPHPMVYVLGGGAFLLLFFLFQKRKALKR